MAQKFKKIVHHLLPQQDPLEFKFINYIMKNGKKSVARKIFLKTMKEIRQS
jgi:ribosomal protein S7